MCSCCRVSVSSPGKCAARWDARRFQLLEEGADERHALVMARMARLEGSAGEPMGGEGAPPLVPPALQPARAGQLEATAAAPFVVELPTKGEAMQAILQHGLLCREPQPTLQVAHALCDALGVQRDPLNRLPYRFVSLVRASTLVLRECARPRTLVAGLQS